MVLGTKKLYQTHAYITEFDARIIEKKNVGANVAVVLDQTYFYPEAGGQQSDRGSIESLEVLEVIEEGNKILHIMKEAPAVEKVHCVLDWKRRFDFMQQHTGQHILSQCFLKLENARTISAHMGETRNTIDLGIKMLSWDTINKVESYANAVVNQALPVNIHFFENIGECPFDLRKQPVVEGTIRIIEIPDFDATPCGGTHCRNTSEAGLVKIVDFEKYKGGYRIEFLCGERALKNYQAKVMLIASLKNELNTKEEDLFQIAHKMKENEKILKKQLEDASWDYIELLCKAIMRSYHEQPVKILVKEFPGYSLEKLKKIASVLTGKIPAIIVLHGLEEQINLVISKPKSFAANLKDICLPLLMARGWRGGGTEFLLTGILPKNSDSGRIISEISALFQDI